MIRFLKKLGPGLLFAGAAIGVSHLVQSTKAGAEFGFGLIWALLLCNFFKYPFFFFGTKYVHATGNTLLDGYKKIHKSVLIIYFVLSLVTIFTIQAAVTIVTAGLAIELFGITENITIWAVIIIIISYLILVIGKYKLLDNLIKIIILILGISTVVAVIVASWMPAPLDISIWQSIWTKEKLKIDNNINYKTSVFDFNVGYLTTVFLGLCFVGLGAYVMFGSGEKFSDQGGVFATQLINLYTTNLGDGMLFFIAIAAFTTMFSTTITCLDASPRAMSKTINLLNLNKLNSYESWILILSIGTISIFVFFVSEMGSLVKIATILSFITAPLYAIINYLLVSGKQMPDKHKISLTMKIYSILGIIFLSFFSIWYITLL